MGLLWLDNCLWRVTFGHASAFAAWQGLDLATEPGNGDAFARDLRQRLRRFVLGRSKDDFLDVPLHTTGMSDFRKAVIHHCRHVPFGGTCSYAALAGLAGRPRAARAVGRVMACNQFPLIVPCHRVVASNGGLTGFSAPDGLGMKQRLLSIESRG